MPDPELRIAVRPAEGGTRIELAGELDVSTAPLFLRAADEITTTEGDVWLDCSNLTFADSTGLDALTRASKAVRAQERRLVLTNVRAVVRRAMDVLQITELFELGEPED